MKNKKLSATLKDIISSIRIIFNVKQMVEYIYLIREREFKYSNKPVYKIGRTNKIATRMNSYPKDSEVYLIEPVYNSVFVEKELISIFEDIYERATTEDGTEYIGNESFVGNVNEMIYIIRTFINNQFPKAAM